MNITISHQNPWSISENMHWIIKNPKNQKFRKYPLNAWKYAWKHESKTKTRDRMVLPALREENLAKIEEENDKKMWSATLPSRREKKSWKTFWKRYFWNSQRIVLKKPEIRSWIDRKTGSINRTRQRLT